MLLNEIMDYPAYIGGEDQAFAVGTDMRTAQKSLRAQGIRDFVVISKETFEEEYAPNQRQSFATIADCIRYIHKTRGSIGSNAT